MTVDLLSSNPEPATFLMGTIASELENISKMLSSDSSRRRVGELFLYAHRPEVVVNFKILVALLLQTASIIPNSIFQISRLLFE